MEGDRVWHGRCDVAGRGGLGVGVGGGGPRREKRWFVGWPVAIALARPESTVTFPH
jgi:hypothetical protein